MSRQIHDPGPGTAVGARLVAQLVQTLCPGTEEPERLASPARPIRLHVVVDRRPRTEAESLRLGNGVIGRSPRLARWRPQLVESGLRPDVHGDEIPSGLSPRPDPPA